MKKILLSFALMAVAVAFGHAQTTVVSAQILDPANNPYRNAVVTVDFINNGSLIAKWNNFPLTVTTWTTNADSNGNFSQALPDLNFIGPATGTFYNFRICANTLVPPGQPTNPCFTYASPACPNVGCITGATITITAAIQAVSLPVPNALLTNVVTNPNGPQVISGSGNTSPTSLVDPQQIGTSVWADAYASVQAAIAALLVISPSGGTVWLTCGKTYTGPPAASYVTGLKLQSTCNITGATLSLNQMGPYTTLLNYSSSLTIGPAQGMTIRGIAFNFSGSATLTMASVQLSVFDMNVTCASPAGSPCVSMTASAANGNNEFNRFDYLNIQDNDAGGSAIGLQLSTPANTSFVTLNEFRMLDILMQRGSNGAIKESMGFTQWCDSNHFLTIHLFYSGINAGNGVVFNDSGTPASNTGVFAENVDMLDITSPGGSITGSAITFNQTSFANAVIAGVGTGSFSTPLTVLNPTVPYWILREDQQGQISTSGGNQSIGGFQMPIGNTATSGANVNSNQDTICGSEWTGSAAATSCWIMQLLTSGSGVPTFDQLNISNTGSQAAGAGNFGLKLNANSLQILTGGAGTTGSISLGRASADDTVADVGINGSFFTDDKQGDLDIQNGVANKTIRIGNGGFPSDIQVTGGIAAFVGNTVALTADWTCGTGGTVSTCAGTVIIGSGGGVPLTFALPSFTQSYTLECNGVVGQATAATLNQWNLLTATNGATNVTATYDMATAATAPAYGAVTDQASTTTSFQIAPSWTLGATGTKMPFHIWAKIEGASVSGTVLSLQIVAPTPADLVTIYRGTSCRLF